MSKDKFLQQLEDQAWREYPNQFSPASRCFYRRFDTPTRCACNDDKPGIQLCIAVSDRNFEIDLVGELPDGTWIKFQQWSMPHGYHVVKRLVPRLLALWEAAARTEQP